MNATQTATIFPSEMIQDVARSHGSPRFVRMPRQAPGTHAAAVQTNEHSVSIKDVRALIRSAGPLPMSDIAGGLDIPERDVSNVVSQMMAENLLQQDEWNRYRVCGGCR